MFIWNRISYRNKNYRSAPSSYISDPNPSFTNRLLRICNQSCHELQQHLSIRGLQVCKFLRQRVLSRKFEFTAFIVNHQMHRWRQSHCIGLNRSRISQRDPMSKHHVEDVYTYTFCRDQISRIRDSDICFVLSLRFLPDSQRDTDRRLRHT